MIYENEADVCRQIEAIGIQTSGSLIVGTSKPVKCHVDGDKGTFKRGWYWLSELKLDDGAFIITGAFGIWQGVSDPTKNGGFNGKMKVELPERVCDKCGTTFKRTRRTCPSCSAKTFTEHKISNEQIEAMRHQMRERSKALDAERKRKQKRAAMRASQKWRALSVSGESEYLKLKQVSACPNAPVRFAGTAVVVPMKDINGAIHGLQFILDKSDKSDANQRRIKRLNGGNKKTWPPNHTAQCKLCLIEDPANRVARAGILLITEGYATGASLHMATGLPVAVVFSAGNILPCLKLFEKHYSRARFLICADDDYLCFCQHCKKQTLVADDDGKTIACAHCGEPHGKKNTGISVASAAALAVGRADWVLPKFTDRTNPKTGKPIKWTDFNDLHVQEGLQIVETQITNAIEVLFPHVGSAAEPSARDALTGGAGNKHKLPNYITVDEAIARFVQVFDVKDTMFDRYLSSLLPKSSMLDIIPDHAWRDIKQHPDRQLVLMEQVGFDPTESDTSIKCNMWGGWPTVPSSKGSCNKLLELLEFICSEEDKPRDVYKWVLRWLAYPIQNPGAKMKTALVIHGGQGVGKNLFFEAVMKIYGEYGRVVGQADIEDKFNDWVSRKLFLIANEVVARQELFHQKNKLKALITDDTIRINPKNVAAHYESNHMNMVFLSNEAQPVVLDADDRRYMAIWTPKKRDKAFYREVMDEIADGGVEALHQYLLDLDLGDFDNGCLPLETRARKALIEVSKESPDRFIEAWMNGELEHACKACSLSDLYRVYERWCRTEGERFSYAKNKFSARIHIYDEIEIAKKPVLDSSGKVKVLRVVLPDADQKPDEATWQTWLGECVASFKRDIEPDGGM